MRMHADEPIRVVAGQWRWRWDLNPRKGCPFTRFRELRPPVRHSPRPFPACANTPGAYPDGQSRPGVNETKTETTPRPQARSRWCSTGARAYRGR